jgi:hypothetical protein
VKVRKYGNSIRVVPWLYLKWRAPGTRVAPFVGESRVGFMHAHPGGAPVLRGEASWRTICGFFVNVRGWGFITVQVRRHWQPKDGF